MLKLTDLTDRHGGDHMAKIKNNYIHQIIDILCILTKLELSNVKVSHIASLLKGIKEFKISKENLMEYIKE